MKRRTAIITITYLAVFCVAFGAAALVQRSRAENYRLSAQHNYHHAFSELVTALSELDTALQKSVYATSSETIGALCTDAFGKAMTAQITIRPPQRKICRSPPCVSLASTAAGMASSRITLRI